MSISNNKPSTTNKFTVCKKVQLDSTEGGSYLKWTLCTLDGYIVYSTTDRVNTINLSQKDIYYIEAGTKLILQASNKVGQECESSVLIEYQPDSIYTSLFEAQWSESGIYIIYNGVVYTQ